MTTCGTASARVEPRQYALFVKEMLALERETLVARLKRRQTDGTTGIVVKNMRIIGIDYDTRQSVDRIRMCRWSGGEKRRRENRK